MQPRIQFATTFYPEFLRGLYKQQPGLSDADYEDQLAIILDTKFSSLDALSRELGELGCSTDIVIVNADDLQAQWTRRHGVSLSGNRHDKRRQILAAQVEHFRPHVLYVFEWSPLGDAFLAEIKGSVRLLVGQVASPLRPERTYEAYDLMVSSWPPIVDYFRGEGTPAAYVRLAFDRELLDRLSWASPAHDITFVGGFAPSHPNRVPWLERLLDDVELDIFGYGWEKAPESSPIHRHLRGSAWGWRMYETLQRSRITLNLHAVNDVRGVAATNFANNLRLFEATGVGACLLTDAKDNLHEMFTPGEEVLVYENETDCIEKIRYYLEHEDERLAIARAGQERTLRDHNYSVRAGELLDVLQTELHRPRSRQERVQDVRATRGAL